LGDIRNEIKSYIAASGRTLTDVVNEINKRHPFQPTTPQNISNKLARGTIRYSECKEIADVLGMEIRWQRKQ
jgi:hypothetical protein